MLAGGKNNALFIYPSEGCSGEEYSERQEGKGKISKGFFRGKKLQEEKINKKWEDRLKKDLMFILHY